MSDNLEAALSTLLQKLDSVTNRLDSLEKRLASGAQGGSSSSSAASVSVDSGEVAASVTEYDDLVSKYIKPFVALSSDLGDADVAAQAKLVADATRLQREFLSIASRSKKPNDSTLGTLLQPTAAKLDQIRAYKDKYPKSHKYFNHLATIADTADAFVWVAVTPKPGPHVAEAKNASMFYSNKILTEYKGKDQKHVDWVNLFMNGFLKDLQDYIKKFHTTGVTWNPKGGDASAAAASSDSSSNDNNEDGGSIPPPPGPPPPPPSEEDLARMPNRGGNDKSGKPDASAMFAELAQGEDITKKLKKTFQSKEEKEAWKAREKSSVVPAKEKPTSGSTSNNNNSKAAVTKPPKFALEGNKWLVEYQIGNKNIVIDDTEPKHTVYVSKCKDTVVQVKGKVNAIFVDGCTKTGIVFDNAIASCEVVNCSSIQVQVTGKVPSFAVDKTDGCQLFLSAQSLESEIVTSKSSELNVCFPSGSDGDIVEMPIPEQYKTKVVNGKLHTEISSHV